MIRFVDRKEELEFLKEKFKSDKFELIILTGRRRIGETTLVKKAIKNEKAIYLMI